MAKVVRKKYIVKKDLQLRLFLELVIFMFFVAALVGITMILVLYRTLLNDLRQAGLMLSNIGILQNFREEISFQLLIWFLPTVFAIVIISVFLTHKIAGPIFVFQRAIKQMFEGQEVRTIRLRKYDKLNDFAADLNRLIEHVNREKSSDTKQ